MPLLEIRNLTVSFDTSVGEFFAVKGIDLHVDAREVLAIVGESGSGKSVAMLAVMGLLPASATVKADSMTFEGRDLLHMPDAATAQAVPATEARQIVAAQSRDFNEFRRKLAASAPSAEVATQSRSASGKVQTQVEDKRPAQAAPDKLTLSKGAIKGQKGTDEKLAQDKQSGENAARMAELSRERIAAALENAPQEPRTA